jgi:hypothetical protein
MPFTGENSARLLRAVSDLNPRLSHTVDKRPLTMNPAELLGFKNLYLLTDLGRLDVLGSLPPHPDAEAVMRAAWTMVVGGITLRVVSLEHLIEVKASMDRPKDKHVEVELRALAATLKRPGSG